jgi:hypothetical protein
LIEIRPLTSKSRLIPVDRRSPAMSRQYGHNNGQGGSGGGGGRGRNNGRDDRHGSNNQHRYNTGNGRYFEDDSRQQNRAQNWDNRAREQWRGECEGNFFP